MAKDYGNIVFYRTKNGKLRWFDPTKIPGGHPREKKVAKAVEHGKAFRSDTSRNLKELRKEEARDKVKETKQKSRWAQKDYEDAAEYEVPRAVKWGQGRYGRTPEEEKAEAKKLGTKANQASNAARQALNDARREDPEAFGKNRRDQQNINRAKKKIEQNKAYEAKHPRSAIEAASWIKNDGKDLQEKMKAKGIEDVKHEGNYRFSGRDKDGNRVIINTEPNQNDRMMGDMIRVTSIQTEKPAAPKEVKRTEMTPEREERAARALAKKQLNKEAIAQTEAYDREDAAAKRTRNANYKLMNEEGNWDRTGGNNREDIIAARRELKKAGNAWRAASNDSERADLEAKRAANTLNQNKITDRDQLNIGRAKKRAEERKHIADIKKAVEKSPYANPNFDYDKYGKYFDVLDDGTVGIKDRNKMSELTNKLYGQNLNKRSAEVQNAPMEDPKDVKRFKNSTAEEFRQQLSEAKTGIAAEPEKKQQPIRYVIKDRHGNQLSSPNENDGELWDRVADRDPDGRRGLHVVAHVEEKSQEKAKPAAKATTAEEKGIATSVDPKWSEYDRTVGKQHLMNYGRIYLDEYGVPVDDEYVTEDRHRAYQRTRKRKKAWKD